MLNLKEKNVFFKENFYKEEKINGIIYKIFEGYLSYQPDFCPKCGAVFDSNFEKHGFIISNIKIPDVSGFKAILRLHKQRYLCKHCHKAFTLTSNITNYGCFISNNTKHKIACDLVKKRSEKDIALDNNVSPNTVERIMDSYYETQKLYKHSLPEVLSFDEFKSVKSADGAMSFHMCDGINGKTIDIIEDRRLDNLIKYFHYYDYKARSRVKHIIIDMYSPYVSLIKKMFPNAAIVIDKFHLTQLISRSLNKTRINVMNKNMKTSLKTLIEFLPHIKNTFETNYHNGFIEGNNNFIKVLKRIAFGFRSFRRFKARIMICKGLLQLNKKIANAHLH